jgi:hypothetical protein
MYFAAMTESASKQLFTSEQSARQKDLEYFRLVRTIRLKRIVVNKKVLLLYKWVVRSGRVVSDR